MRSPQDQQSTFGSHAAMRMFVPDAPRRTGSDSPGTRCQLTVILDNPIAARPAGAAATQKP